jgi:hypothetical protein
MVSWLVGPGAEPDEDVGHTDRGLVADGQLVEAGRHRPELLAAVHQPLHLVALAVALAVEGRWPPTTGTPTGSVGLLVVALGMVWGSGGRAGGAVGPAGVGLVAGQVIGTRAGPTPPTRAATRTWSTSPTSWVVSASCPGVRQVARLRPRPSQMVWTLVVSPPRDRPRACCRLAWIEPSPFSWPQRRAGGP